MVKDSELSILDFDAIGDDHISTASETPITSELFALSDEERKIELQSFCRRSCKLWA